MTEYQDYGFPGAGPAHTIAYLEGPLTGLLNKNKSQLILDLGCGNGYLATRLLSQGYDTYGTDASEAGIAIARRFYPDRFFLQDLSTGRLPDELAALHFDTIISTEVIEHLYDPAGFLRLCRAILDDNGTLLISTPYHGYLKNLLISLLGRWDRHMDPLWSGGHIKLWSRRTLTKALQEAGFRITAFKGCGRFPYFWRSMLIKAVADE